MADSTNLGSRLLAFWLGLLPWSRRTFGDAEVRGPIGPLKHLAKEAQEAANDPSNIEEYADCFIIFSDALWRAGFNWHKLLGAVEKKMKVNKQRTWPKVDPGNNEPMEHV